MACESASDKNDSQFIKFIPNYFADNYRERVSKELERYANNAEKTPVELNSFKQHYAKQLQDLFPPVTWQKLLEV